jgi:hypothetical protein
MGRVLERRRAVALAWHYREFEGLSIRQIADRFGRTPATIKGRHRYAQRGKPAVGLRLLGGALALSFVLMLASGLALIVGPSGAHSAARTIHVVSAYIVVVLLSGHVAVHLWSAARLVSADIRPRTPKVQGARSRWLALLVSLTLVEFSRCSLAAAAPLTAATTTPLPSAKVAVLCALSKPDAEASGPASRSSVLWRWRLRAEMRLVS